MQEGEEIQGAVSLWVGFSPSQDALEAYVEIDYTTDESPHLSRFSKDFGTGWLDEDFMDMSFHKWSTRSLSDLLHGCSYDALIIPKFVALCGELLPTAVNSAVLLYNFQHNGSPGPGANARGPVRLQYMGSIRVEMPWPD